MVDWIKEPISLYSELLELMQSIVNDLKQCNANETIILTEHKDVYTIGHTTPPSDIINTHNIPVIKTNRGGKATYHGPGQRIIYPILNLSSPNRKRDIKFIYSKS